MNVPGWSVGQQRTLVPAIDDVGRDRGQRHVREGRKDVRVQQIPVSVARSVSQWAALDLASLEPRLRVLTERDRLESQGGRPNPRAHPGAHRDQSPLIGQPPLGVQLGVERVGRVVQRPVRAGVPGPDPFRIRFRVGYVSDQTLDMAPNVHKTPAP